MGCRLPKLRKTEERRSPGNIYSTLRRPQVETKVGVSYTYHFLDFLLGKEEVPVSSVLCLSSVRELPVQVRELYAQGFVLVAVHPFVHSCGPRHAHIQRQLHRAVLVRETPSSEKSQMRWARQRLETDVCVAGHQAADPEVIQSYTKKIQDVAEQGMMFVGFLQQPGGGPYFLGQLDPEELSSLHSSPSPIHRSPFSTSNSQSELTELHYNSVEPDLHCTVPQDLGNLECSSQHMAAGEVDFIPLKATQSSELGSYRSAQQPESPDGVHRCPTQQQEEPLHRDSTERHLNLLNQRERPGDSWLSSPELQLNHRKRYSSVCPNGQSRDRTHNNNHICLRSTEKDKNTTLPPAQARIQLFALYNHTGELNTALRFYSLRVPLRLQKEAGLITGVDANWLDHMTQHFSSGAQLIDGFFHLEDNTESGVSSVDSVFVFKSSAEETSNVRYDAIVVEQWTVVDGVVVKTDYIPLLQSLAPFGWRLMCVLPTPIVKTNSDGSLSTKQILFLQRPVLQRKRKDFKMLNLRGRSKAKKNSAEDERQIRHSAVNEAEMDTLGRNTKHAEKEMEMRKSRAERPQSQDGGKNRAADVTHQHGFLFLSGRRGSVEDQEEETDVDMIPLSRQEKTVRWTDVCQSIDGEMMEKVKMEERIKHQLFSGVC